MPKKTTKKAKRTGWITTASLRGGWQAALNRLAAAEQEAERQVRRLIKRNRLDAADAKELLATLGSRVARERRRLRADLAARLKGFEARVKKERRALGQIVDETVRGTLAALNIPSRREVAELTRRVEELTRKIDAFRRPARRR